MNLLVHPQIDLQTFLTLTDQDLKELGITTFGARRKMLLAISGEYNCSLYLKTWRLSASGLSQWGWFCFLPGRCVVVVSKCFSTNSVTNAEDTPTPSPRHCLKSCLDKCHPWKQISSERSNQNFPLQNMGMEEEFESLCCSCVKC